MQPTLHRILAGAALAILYSGSLVQPAAGQSFKVIDSLPADFNLNGSGAESGLLLHGGNLIGASRIGGVNGLGTVYEVAIQTGQETILHRSPARQPMEPIPMGVLPRTRRATCLAQLSPAEQTTLGPCLNLIPQAI